MSKPSEKYFDKVERWLLGGISIEKMVMSPDQRFRAMLAYEVYQRWLQDKQLRASDVLRNIAAREYLSYSVVLPRVTQRPRSMSMP